MENPKLYHAKNLYLEGIKEGKVREAVAKYTGDQYIQHSTGVRDGQEGFIEFFEPFIERNPVRDIQVIRELVDGEYVFLHVYQSLNNGEAQWVTTDFFRTDTQDRIIEHWDVIAPFHAHTPSGHTSIDGPTTVTDLEHTEANKELVCNLIKDALMPGGNPHLIDQYISKDQYIQHNAEVADGLEHFKALATQPNPPLKYTDVVLVVGQGNFVATLCKANWNDGKINQDYAQVDLFRIENGLVVEHWDNVEPVPEVSVNSGKF